MESCRLESAQESPNGNQLDYAVYSFGLGRTFFCAVTVCALGGMKFC